MSKKKNKRYTLYRYWGKWEYYEHHYTKNSCNTTTNDAPTWTCEQFTRDQLIVKLAWKLKFDKDTFKYITNDMDVIPDRTTYEFDRSTRPGIRYTVETDHVVYAVKVTSCGKDKSVNLDALEKCVVKKLDKISRPKRRNSPYCWNGNTKPWKDNYKCRHQWEIHQRKKVYVVKGTTKQYDPSWEREEEV